MYKLYIYLYFSRINWIFTYFSNLSVEDSLKKDKWFAGHVYSFLILRFSGNLHKSRRRNKNRIANKCRIICRKSRLQRFQVNREEDDRIIRKLDVTRYTRRFPRVDFSGYPPDFWRLTRVWCLPRGPCTNIPPLSTAPYR